MLRESAWIKSQHVNGLSRSGGGRRDAARCLCCASGVSGGLFLLLLGQNVLCQINNIIIMSALQKVPLDWIIITIFIVLLHRMAWYLHSTFWFIQISTMTFWLLSTCKYVVSFIKKYVALDNIMVFNWKDSAWIPWYYYGACPKKCGTVVYKAQWCIPYSTMLLMDYPFNYHVTIWCMSKKCGMPSLCFVPHFLDMHRNFTW